VAAVCEFSNSCRSRSCYCSSYEIATTRTHPIASPNLATITQLYGEIHWHFRPQS
jgi:hypothetical protein